MIWKKKHNFSKENTQVYAVLLDCYKRIYNFMFSVIYGKGFYTYL